MTTKKPGVKKVDRHELEFDITIYDIEALKRAVDEFGPEAEKVYPKGKDRIVVEFVGDEELEMEFRNLALLRTIEEKKSR